MRTTIVARLRVRWLVAMVAAAGLALALVLAAPSGPAARADELPPMASATPAEGTVAGATSTGWSQVTFGPCPGTMRFMSALLIKDPADRSYSKNFANKGNFGSGSRTSSTDPSTNITVDALGWSTDKPALAEAGTYEIIAFCGAASFMTDATAVPSYSAWLTHDTVEWSITAEPPVAETTTMTLAATAGGEPVTSVEVGTEVDVEVTVAPAEAAGTVALLDGGTEVGEAALSGGTASFGLDDLDVGSHPLTAQFTPEDASAYTPSQTSPVTLTVTAPDAVETTVELSVNPVDTAEAGRPVTLTARVDPATAQGSVQFRRDDAVIGEPADLSDGQASLTTSDLPAGELSLTAAFVPDDADAFGGSMSSPVTYTVTEAAPPEEPVVTATDADGNPLDENPVLQPDEVVTLTAPGFEAAEQVTVTVDAGTEGEQQVGEPVAADDEGSVVQEFTASGLTAGQHQLNFVGADSELDLAWQFQIAEASGDEDGGAEDGDEDGGDESGGDEDGGAEDGGAADGGAVDGAAGGTAAGGTAAGATGGGAASGNPSGGLAQTGPLLAVPLALLGMAAVSAGYAMVRRSRNGDLLTFDDEGAA